MSFLDALDTSTHVQTSLSPGSYGSAKEPGLKIMSYIEKASKIDKGGAMRHSFLVAALKPSREATEAHKGKNGANPNPLDQLDSAEYEGTAFLSVTLHELWLNLEATSLAFTEASRNKEGVIQNDHVAKALLDGDVTEDSIAKARAHFLKVATDKCTAANTPAEQMDAAVQTRYEKDLIQIWIKVRQFLALQDWKGVPRNLQFDPLQLVGVEFSGKCESEEFNGKTRSEITAIYSKSQK
jgi:hypothetical protein